MNKNLLWTGAAAVALGAIILWAVLWKGADTQPVPSTAGPRAAGDAAPAGSVRVAIASSSTKKNWMEAAGAAFNEASKRDRSLQVDGKPVFVEFVLEEIEKGKFDHYRSGTMVQDTLSEKIKPVVVSPSEDSWVAALSREWKSTKGGEIAAGQAEPLVRVPLVIALWESRARALGCWPDAGPDCTWARLRALASSPNGWGMLGHPEWGKFKFGYGYVGESNSGTLTATSLCMIGLNKTSGLSIEEVQVSNGCGQTMAAVEKAKVHSGKKSGWLLGWMETGGPEYLDGVTTNEPDVIAFNQTHRGKLREILVSAYPQDGTVIALHPYAILDGAPWVSLQQVTAAQLFRGYLLSQEQQRAALQQGLRPADPSTILTAPVEPRNGANPKASLVPISMPDPLTFARITEVWHRVKKHAVIALVFDKSGSMQGEKMTRAIAGGREFVKAMDPEDTLIWMPFDDQVFTGTNGPKSAIGERLIGDIGSTVASGGTALYDAVGTAYRNLQSRRASLGDGVRYGIVILSDGQDTSSRQTSLVLLEATLKPAEGDPTGIQIHTIGIGGDADRNVLTKIASSAHGKYWDAKDPGNVLDIYREIAVHY